MEKDSKKQKNTAGGLVFIGCMFIGMGTGYFLGNLVTGLFIGMGVGFVGYGIIYLLVKN